MRRRNPVSASPRRGGGSLTPQGVARLRRALARRRGFPRGAGIDAAAARAADAWFLGVDVRFASADWIARVAEAPARPQGEVGEAQMRAYLATLEALRPWARAEERSMLFGPAGPPRSGRAARARA